MSSPSVADIRSQRHPASNLGVAFQSVLKLLRSGVPRVHAADAMFVVALVGLAAFVVTEIKAAATGCNRSVNNRH